MGQRTKASREAAAAAAPPPPSPPKAPAPAAPAKAATPAAPKAPAPGAVTKPVAPTRPAAATAPAPARGKVPAVIKLQPPTPGAASTPAAQEPSRAEMKFSVWRGEEAARARAEAARKGPTEVVRMGKTFVSSSDAPEPAFLPVRTPQAASARTKAVAAAIAQAPTIGASVAEELLKSRTGVGRRYAAATEPQTGEYGDSFTRMHEMRRSGRVGVSRPSADFLGPGLSDIVNPESAAPSTFRRPVRVGVTEQLTPKEGRPVTLTANLQLPSPEALFDRDKYKEEVEALGARYSAASARLEKLLPLRRELEAAKDAAKLAELARQTRETQQELVDIRASLPEYGMDPADVEKLARRNP